MSSPKLLAVRVCLDSGAQGQVTLSPAGMRSGHFVNIQWSRSTRVCSLSDSGQTVPTRKSKLLKRWGWAAGAGVGKIRIVAFADTTENAVTSSHPLMPLSPQ